MQATPPEPAPFHINRRRFLQTGAAATALAALPARGADALELALGKTRRVGLIGAGWYGPSDLWRLIQVAPVEVVGLGDPDQNMLASGAGIASQRQKSRRRPPTYNDYRQMLKEQPCDIVVIGSPDHWHALHAIAAIEAG
ncbi:MAG TPA: Gfo/Idh/MocA family oxidoreductase, partial [Verrucomicrobiota bacterium]|nr:Gfo/Idh/MocA family oxidoreductase [Verrucomicrobiota bacterium]